MVSILCVLFLILFIFFCVKLVNELKQRHEFDSGPAPFYLIMSIIFGILSGIFFYYVFSLVNTVETESTIDRKIAMYEKENASIEESIDFTVRSYMDFKSITYGELKDNDAINLVSIFPELKSDTLVQRQIEIYISNNNRIKSLKEEKIDLSKAKWELYFGR